MNYYRVISGNIEEAVRAWDKEAACIIAVKQHTLCRNTTPLPTTDFMIEILITDGLPVLIPASKIKKLGNFMGENWKNYA